MAKEAQKRLRRGRPPADGAGRTSLPGLRARRYELALSQDAVVAAAQAERIRGARPPAFGRSAVRSWETGGTAPVEVVPFLARALRTTQRALTEAAP